MLSTGAFDSYSAVAGWTSNYSNLFYINIMGGPDGIVCPAKAVRRNVISTYDIFGRPVFPGYRGIAIERLGNNTLRKILIR